MVLLLLGCAQPAPTEICNGLDDDGDGRVDNGVVTAVLAPGLVDSNGIPWTHVSANVELHQAAGVAWRRLRQDDWEESRQWDRQGRMIWMEQRQGGAPTWQESTSWGPHGPDWTMWWMPRDLADMHVEWRWTYDDLGREILKEHWAGGIQSFQIETTYTEDGRLVVQHDDDGIQWLQQYDTQDRPVWTRYDGPDGCAIEIRETWSDTEHIIQRWQPCDADPWTPLEEHFEDGRLVRMVSRTESGQTTEATVEYEDGRPVAWNPTHDSDARRTYAWEDGRLVEIQTQTETTTLVWADEGLVSVHDANGRLMSVTYTRTGVPRTVFARGHGTYAHDENDNLTSWTNGPAVTEVTFGCHD